MQVLQGIRPHTTGGFVGLKFVLWKCLNRRVRLAVKSTNTMHLLVPAMWSCCFASGQDTKQACSADLLAVP